MATEGAPLAFPISGSLPSPPPEAIQTARRPPPGGNADEI